MADVLVNINQEVSSFQGNNDPVILIVGMKNTLGTAQDGELLQINSDTDIIKYYGTDSHIAQSLRKAITINDIKYFADNKVIIYGLAFNENIAGTADSRTLTFDGTATVASTMSVSVYDSYEYTKNITIAIGDTKTAIATKVKDAFDSLVNFPFNIAISGVDNEILTFTSNVKGGVFKNFSIKIINQSNEITYTIGNATIGATLPTGVKTAIKTVFDDYSKRFWYTCIEPAFLADDSTIYDLITSYKNIKNNTKQTQMVNVKLDTVVNITAFLENFNNENISFSVGKDNNRISELNMATIIASVDARKNTNNASVSDIGLQGSGSISNIPLSVSDLILPLCDIENFTFDEITALSNLNCAILTKPIGQTFVTILSGNPDFKTTLKTLSSGAEATYKYFGDINNMAYCQDYMTSAFKTVDFFKKVMTSGNVLTDNQISPVRARNLIIYRIKELANLGLLSYSDTIEEKIINTLERTVIFNYINRSLIGETQIEFVKEILSVIFNIVPITSYNN